MNSAEPRDTFDTIPYNRVSATALDALAERESVLDERITDSGRPIPEWCVDLGDELGAFTTFELWMRLARGELDRKTRVWRDNMEAWTKIEDIPELAYAFADGISLDPPIVTPAPSAPPPPPIRGEVRTPLTFASTETPTADPPKTSELDHDTAVTESIRIPMRSGPNLGFVRSQRRGALSFALGSAVAVAAIGLGLLRTSGEQPLKVAAAGAATSVKLEAHLGELAGEAGRSALEASNRWSAPVVMPPPPSARHHYERGQHRSRRSSRR